MKQVYVVTGASSGIGLAFCHLLAQHNKKIVVIARREKELNVLRDKYPGLVSIIAADLANPEERNKVIENLSCENILGLVNNAATNDPVSLLQDLPLKEWHKQTAINLDAPIFLTQGLLPFLKEKCRIVNLTTVTTNFVMSGLASYAMTKAALNVFTKYLSEELRPKKILVTAAHPGIAKTGLIDIIIKHGDPNLDIFKMQEHLEKNDKYMDVNVAAKFLYWLLLEAPDELYTGDIIGIYNKKYQLLWHDKIFESPYPANVSPP